MIMDTGTYKKLLLAEEARLLKSADHARADAQELSAGNVVGDWTDESVRDEEEGAQFKTLGDDAKALDLVRAALKRIAEGTFGKCAVDGKPIEEARLRAIPWTPYCLKHEQDLELKNPRPMPTL
jgi:DnaK suppressor protein